MNFHSRNRLTDIKNKFVATKEDSELGGRYIINLGLIETNY